MEVASKAVMYLLKLVGDTVFVGGSPSVAGLAGAVHVRFKGDAITAIDTAASRKD